MGKYDPQKFMNALSKMVLNKDLTCPYCGGKFFSTPEEYASILIGKDLSSIHLGSSIPSGVIVCQKCGHIDFFALGALGLLEKKEDKSSGK